MTPTALQCKAARALLGWRQAELAQAGGIAAQTVADFERGARVPHSRNLLAIRRALEDAGVEFMLCNGVMLCGKTRDASLDK